MKVYYINTLGDQSNRDLCILDNIPEGMGVYYSFLVKGREAKEHYPEDAEIRMTEDREGIQLASLIAHTKRMLVVDSELKEVIINSNDIPGATIEVFPVKIINHKGKVHSESYFIVNPIGYYDVVDNEKSDIDYFEGSVLGINQLVMSAKKLENVPNLFRIAEEPTRYYIKEPLKKAMEAGGFSNIKLVEISVSDD